MTFDRMIAQMEESKKAVRVAVSTGVGKGCTLVVSDAQMLCGGGDVVELGESIYTTIKESTHETIAKVGSQRAEGFDVEYGMQEGRVITGRPFLRPALYANEGKIVDEIKKEVGKMLK